MAHERLIGEGRKALRKNVAPRELQRYFIKRGMDQKEAREAVDKLAAERILEDNKKAEKAAAQKSVQEKGKKESAAPKSKSSGWFLVFIIILIVILIIYLSNSGKLSPEMFNLKNLK